jgi:hypothetical protein
MDSPADTRKQLELQQPCGCAAESSLQSFKAQVHEDQALARTWLGRLVLRLRSLVERAVGR